MALSHQFILRGVADAAIYPLTADTTSSLTYGAKLDIPGIRTFSFEPTMDVSQIEGDDVLQDKRSKMIGGHVTVSGARTSLDVLKTLTGASVVDAGTTPNQTVTMTNALLDVPGAFKLAAQVTQTDTGIAAINFIIYKCRMTTMSFGNLGYGNYGELNFEADALYTVNTPSKLDDVIELETYATLA